MNNNIVPAVSRLSRLNQTYKTFYGNNVNGNVTVMTFKDIQGFTKERVLNIATTISKDLYNKMTPQKLIQTRIQMSVGVRFAFGYKSSTHLTELGEEANIWDPNAYAPDVDVLYNFNNPLMRIHKFDIFLMTRPRAGGCNGSYND